MSIVPSAVLINQHLSQINGVELGVEPTSNVQRNETVAIYLLIFICVYMF